MMNSWSLILMSALLAASYTRFLQRHSIRRKTYDLKIMNQTGLIFFTIASLPTRAMMVSQLMNFASQGTHGAAMVAKLENRHSHHNWSIEPSWIFPAYPKT